MKGLLLILCLFPLVGFTQHDFDCADCHDFGENVYTNACIECHDKPMSHPVLISYPYFEKEMHPMSSQSGLGGTIQTDFLKDNMVQCTSCHQIHFNENKYLLIKQNNGSALCLTCHNK